MAISILAAEEPAAGGFFAILSGRKPDFRHFPDQNLSRNAVFLKEISLTAAKNRKIFPPAAGPSAAKNPPKNPSAANFWGDPPPPGGVWVKQRRESDLKKKSACGGLL